MIHLTAQGDLLDAICHRHYGSESGPVEMVLRANPGLADRGPILPPGIEIDLPEWSAPPAQNLIRLWAYETPV